MGTTGTFHDLTGDLEHSMLVVTAGGDRGPAGCLVGFATQCSIDPPRFAVCLSKANHTFTAAAATDVLAVHALGAGQLDLARLFGEETGDRVDKFSRCRWRRGPGGAPVLEDCPSWFAGRVLQRVDVGDHVALVLEPLAAARGASGPPLLFSAVKGLDAGHRA